MIELKDIRLKRGRHITSIDSWHIDRGSFSVISGPNGAGKTTLLQLSMGLLLPDSGTIRLGGRKLGGLNGWRRAEARAIIGYVPQLASYNLDVPLTVGEVVELGLIGKNGFFGGISESGRTSLGRWLDFFELRQMANMTFRSLSGGQRQKVLIARALAGSPELVVLDEPLANLDTAWRTRLLGLIERIYGEQDITILMVSHESALVSRFCSDVTLIRDGSIVDRGEPSGVFQPSSLANLSD